MTSSLVFIRHGKATDTEGRCIGHTDVLLSESGASDITAVANDLLKQVHSAALAPVTAIIGSDSLRAAGSAALLSQTLGVPFTTDARLREMNFGEWDGRTWAELELADAERLSQWMQHWTTAAPPQGENVTALAARIHAFLIDLLAVQAIDNGTFLVVAHAGSIRAALCALTKCPLEKMFDISVELAKPIEVTVTPEVRARVAAGPLPVGTSINRPH